MPVSLDDSRGALAPECSALAQVYRALPQIGEIVIDPTSHPSLVLVEEKGLPLGDIEPSSWVEGGGVGEAPRLLPEETGVDPTLPRRVFDVPP
jgi:hypothetical protein